MPEPAGGFSERVERGAAVLRKYRDREVKIGAAENGGFAMFYVPSRENICEQVGPTYPTVEACSKAWPSDLAEAVLRAAEPAGGLVEALEEARGCMARQMLSDEATGAPFNEDMALAIKHAEAALSAPTTQEEPK